MGVGLLTPRVDAHIDPRIKKKTTAGGDAPAEVF